MGIILVDQDDVLADFEEAFKEEWTKRYPDRIIVPLEERLSFYIFENYPDEYKEDIIDIYKSEGFYRNMQPIEGGLEAVKYLAKKNDVFICTSPMDTSRFCASEKYDWVKHHLGEEWTRKLILTKDKTLVYGDILIDDKPEITGKRKNPFWEHILYTRPWNKHLNSQKRLIWKNYKEVLNQ